MFRQTLPATTMMLSLLLPGTAWPTGEQNDPHACSFKVWLGKTAEIEMMLGMDMVPPTRAREINGRKGAIQLWVEGCKT